MTSPTGSDVTWIQNIEEATWKGTWIAPKIKMSNYPESAASDDLIIFYIHGGFFCTEDSTTYMESFRFMINHLRDEHGIRASILSMKYSLSPESVWPKALDECANAYKYLVNTLNIPPKKIILVGDSAGGNVIATMLLKFKEPQERPFVPAGAALLSPWIDLTTIKLSFNETNKDFFTPKMVDTYVSYYVPNYHKLDTDSKKEMLKNPLISPFYGEYVPLCPLFISYGGRELLRNSIKAFIEKLKEQGCDVTVLTREDAIHDWMVNRLISTSKKDYESDLKSVVTWLASINKSN